MDSNVSVKRPSKADVSKNNAANVGSEEEVEPMLTTCIEDLPGDVLPIIVSSLKIREVVRASLTCKQWLNLPAYRSNILLDPLSMTDDDQTELCPAHKDLFITRVNKYLQLLEKLQATAGRIPVSMFMIQFCLRRDSSPISIVGSDLLFAMVFDDFTFVLTVILTDKLFTPNSTMKMMGGTYFQVIYWMRLPSY